MNNFHKLNQSHPRYALFFKKLVESEINSREKQEQVLNRIAHNFHTARHAIKNKSVDLFSVKSVELLEDLIYKTNRDSKVERYAKDALSGIARRRGVLNGPGRERALQAFGRIMDIKMSYKDKQQQFFKGISAVKTSEGLADLLENLLDSDIMEKVANSKAVVEYDDGRMALVWIPDFETSKKVGTHNWCISRSDGEDYWDDHSRNLNKCYMIVDRALPASHVRHQFAFHINPSGKVTASHDQRDGPICPDTDNDFQQAIKVTGARPYNRDDMILYDENYLLEEYIIHHRDVSVLSKKILAADNPAFELGKMYSVLKTCARMNLSSCWELVLTVARQCAEKGATEVINKSFLNSIPQAGIAETIVAMIPSLAVAKKHCTTEVFELVQCASAKKRTLADAMLFGNRVLIANLINVNPSELNDSFMRPGKVLSLGAKINRRLLDHGFEPNIYNKKFVRALLFPASQTEKESAEVYFSSQWFQNSSEVARMLLIELTDECSRVYMDEFNRYEWHGPLMDDMLWRLENLKRIMGENSALYAKQIGAMLVPVAEGHSVETAVIRYPRQINHLLDEVDRLEKEAEKESLSEISWSLGDVRASHSIAGFTSEFTKQSLSEDSKATLGRMLATMQNYHANVSRHYVSLLAREGDFNRITANDPPGKRFSSIPLKRFLRTALGRADFLEGGVVDQWLTDAEAWLQGDQSWFSKPTTGAIGRLFKVLRERKVSKRRLACLIKMATNLTFIEGQLMVPVPQVRHDERNSYWSEALDNAEELADFLKLAREMQGRVEPSNLAYLLDECSDTVRAWAFSEGWDDIMSAVGNDAGNCKLFIKELLGSGFWGREKSVLDDGERYLSLLVERMAKAGGKSLVSLAESVERTMPDFDAQSFARKVNQLHREVSSGDLLPLKDINNSESSHCLY